MRVLYTALSYYLRFCVYVWTGENDSNTLRVDANFFKNGKKTSVLKNIRIRVDRAFISLRYVAIQGMKIYTGNLFVLPELL